MDYNLYNKIGFEFIKNMTECSSPYGAELVKKLSPIKDTTLLEREYDNIEKVLTIGGTDRLSSLFMCIKDIRRSIEGIGEGALDEVSLFEIKRYLLQLREIKAEYEKSNLLLSGVEIPSCEKALDILCIDGNCNAGFYINDSYSEKLREIRREKREIEKKIRLAEESTAKLLKLDRMKITERESEEELRIRHEISENLKPYKDDIRESVKAVGHIDFTIAKAQTAKKLGAVRPIIEGDGIRMKEMRNPYVEKLLREKGRAFTPVSIEAFPGSTVITGANMGGKSVALKTLALNCCAAMCGMFVFAKEAYLPVLCDIAMIAEDSEDTRNGLSSFGGEMIRLRDALRNTDECTLLLFDELARGTNPQEGARIVRAVVKYLNTKCAISVFATHYDGIAEYAKKHYRVIGLRDFDFDKVKSIQGVETIAANMNYGLYEAAPDEKCPREAVGIAKVLLHGEPILDVLLDEEEN